VNILIRGVQLRDHLPGIPLGTTLGLPPRKILRQASYYRPHHLQQGQYSVLAPRDLPIHLLGPHLQSLPRRVMHTATEAPRIATEAIQTTSRHLSPPFRVDTCQIISFLRHPAFSPNGASAGRARIPTYSPALSVSQLQRCKAVLVSSAKTNRTKSARALIVGPRKKGQAKNQKHKHCRVCSISFAFTRMLPPLCLISWFDIPRSSSAYDASIS
jgi:hypothetical protein